MNDIRTFYIETYHDRFFSHPPAWFTMYLWLELVYHVPLSFWAVGALLRSPYRTLPFGTCGEEIELIVDSRGPESAGSSAGFCSTDGSDY